MPTIVLYKGAYYVHFGNTSNGAAKLLDTDGKVFPGTPSVSKLEKVKELPTRQFNGSSYFATKIGVFSCSNGHRIVHPSIVALFN